MRNLLRSPLGGRLAGIWQRLTEASPEVEAVIERRKASMLAAMMVFSIPVSLLAVAIPSLLIGLDRLVESNELRLSLISAVMAIGIYALSRTRHYQIGAIIVVFQSIGVIFFVMLTGDLTNANAFFYLVISVLLSGVFLSERLTLAVTVVNLGGMLLFPLIRPEATLLDITSPFSFNLLMYPIMFFAFYQRAMIEKVREALVQQDALAAERLRAQLEQERGINRLRDKFISMVSHEFRTPLATILSSVEMIQFYSDRLPPEKQKEYFDLIPQEVRRLTGMLDDVLTVSRITSGTVEYKPMPVNVNAFFRDVLAQGDLDMGRVVAQLPAEEEKVIQTDPHFLEAIIRKLVHNALRYSDAETPVTLDIALAEDHLRVTVRDQGVGIAPEDQPKVYEPFYRGRNTVYIRGTGLGLSIVKGYVDLMQGTIDCDSTEGQGTAFTVRLPHKQPSAVTGS